MRSTWQARGRRCGVVPAAVLLLPVALVALLAAASPAGAEVATEYQVKASFLYHFLRFTDWPPAAARGATDPVRVGIAGEDPFDGGLASLLASDTVAGRGIVVRRVGADFDPDDLDVLFVSGSDPQQAKTLLERVAARPVLTVGEQPGFCKLGGLVNFTLRDHKIAFEILLSRAQQLGFQFNSRMLNLAQIVPGS